MAIAKTKHFRSTQQATLEEQMNLFLATLPLALIMDIQISTVHVQSAAVLYTGVVVYQE